MNGRGLQDSRWASPARGIEKQGSNTWASDTPRDGDWICVSCSFSNFQWRTECFRCRNKRYQSEVNEAVDALASKLDYSAPNDLNNWESMAQIETRGSSERLSSSLPKHTGGGFELETTPLNGSLSGYSTPNRKGDTWAALGKGGGLATSRWAPKHSNGRSNGDTQVWTRVSHDLS